MSWPLTRLRSGEHRNAIRLTALARLRSAGHVRGVSVRAGRRVRGKGEPGQGTCVAVQCLIHHLLVVASEPGGAERRRLHIRSRDGLAGPGRVAVMMVASIRATSSSTSAIW
jgi:hypothetical protein